MTTIPSFVERLKKIGITVGLVGNYPWVYLLSVNGKRVEEKYLSDHNFTVFWRAIKPGQKDRITNIPKVFATIRKHL
jgi:hypothetical protein